MSDPVEISRRLREQKITIQKMAYALTLAAPDSASRIEAEAHCVCEWINDACEALSSAQRADVEKIDGR